MTQYDVIRIFNLLKLHNTYSTVETKWHKYIQSIYLWSYDDTHSDISIYKVYTYDTQNDEYM